MQLPKSLENQQNDTRNEKSLRINLIPCEENENIENNDDIETKNQMNNGNFNGDNNSSLILLCHSQSPKNLQNNHNVRKDERTASTLIIPETAKFQELNKNEENEDFIQPLNHQLAQLDEELKLKKPQHSIFFLIC